MRIVAGEFKGRRLAGPEGSATRPTSDKVREALFSILGDISGDRVLDLFAGTGALTLEALSRGAADALLIERDRRMAGVAARNIETVLGAGQVGPGHDRARLLRTEALAWLKSTSDGPFDLIFIDPPYADAQDLAAELSAALPAVISSGARIVTESDRRSPLDLTADEFGLRSEHRYGDTLLRIFDAP